MAPTRIRLTQELAEGGICVSHLNFSAGFQEHHVTIEPLAHEEGAPNVLSFSEFLGEQESKAALRVRPNSVTLRALNSDVRIGAWGWGFPVVLNHPDELAFPVPESTDRTPLEFPLRPGDTFYVDGQSCLIDIADDTQVDSSAPGNAEAAESQYLQSNGQMAILQDEKTLVAGASTPDPHSSDGITIKETPMKTFRTKKAANVMVSGVVKNAMQGKENSQNWSSNPMNSGVLGIMREQGRLSRSEMSSPPPEGLKVEPPDTQTETINPQLLRQDSPNEEHPSKTSVGMAEQADGSVEAKTTTDPADDETTDAESDSGEAQDLSHLGAEHSLFGNGKGDETSKSTSAESCAPVANPNENHANAESDTGKALDFSQRGAERSLFGNGKKDEISEPTGVESSASVVKPNEIHAGKEGNVDVPSPTYIQKGAKIAVYVGRESQPGSQHLSTLHRSATGDRPESGHVHKGLKRAAPANEEDQLNIQGPGTLVQNTTGKIPSPSYDQRSPKRAKTTVPADEDFQDETKHPNTLEYDVTNDEDPPMASPQKKAPRKSPHSAQSKSTSKRTGKGRASAAPATSFESSTFASKEGSATPTSSFRSTRSGARESFDNVQSPGTSLRVVFANSASVDQSKPFMKFLANHGIKQVKDVAKCDILCVGKDTELKRTSNLITAVACGKSVVTDDWVSNSFKQGKMLDPENYEAKDPEREKEWDTTLNDASERGRQGINALSDWSISFTPGAKTKLGQKGFTDLKQICMLAGAKAVAASTPKKRPQELETALVIAAEDDKDLEQLFGNGWQPYTKDVITYSILRGRVDVEGDEFKIDQPTPKAPEPTGKKRKR